MDRRIIYSRTDGGVSVVVPIRKITDVNLTDEQIYRRAYDRVLRDMDPMPYYRDVVSEKLGRTPSDAEVQAYMDQRNIKPLDASNPQTITASDIPADRTFREAWEHGGNKILVNMPRARDIHLGRIREARNKALADMDIETIKAMGQGDNKALVDVEAQKQVLRDIPQTIDLDQANTPEELRAIWPKELK